MERNTGVKVVVEIAPELEGCGFVLVLRQLVVDISELDALGIVPVIDTANTVLEHLLIGNALLRTAGSDMYMKASDPESRERADE